MLTGTLFWEKLTSNEHSEAMAAEMRPMADVESGTTSSPMSRGRQVAVAPPLQLLLIQQHRQPTKVNLSRDGSGIAALAAPGGQERQCGRLLH